MVEFGPDRLKNNQRISYTNLVSLILKKKWGEDLCENRKSDRPGSGTFMAIRQNTNYSLNEECSLAS